jgi:hypothetical protein
MPKININDEVTDGFRVEVGWGPGTWVQVGTTNATSPLVWPAESEDVSEEPAVKPEPFLGWFVTLNRDGINRLIRALRRARDEALGADA